LVKTSGNVREIRRSSVGKKGITLAGNVQVNGIEDFVWRRGVKQFCGNELRLTAEASKRQIN